MARHTEFEWHPAKEAANIRKHGLKFTDAMLALSDDWWSAFHEETYQGVVDGEDRWLTLAPYPPEPGIVFAVAWTPRRYGDRLVTRLISARALTPRERKEYAKKNWN